MKSNKQTEVNLFLDGFTEIVEPRIEPASVNSMQLIFFVVMALVYDNKYENSSHFFIRKCAKLPPHAHSKLLSKWFPHARCNLRLLSTRPHAILCLVYMIRTYSFSFFCRNTSSPNVFSLNKKTYSEFSQIISPIKKSLGLVGNNRRLLNS